jgi:L-cystine transport system substrate-binding protein
MMMQRGIVRGVGALCAGFAAVVVALSGASAAPPKTIEPGKLHVALNGDMPMTGLEDGRLIGTDGELMVLIAERLGLEVVPHMMEWSAEIQSTKQGKVDIMHGAMGWIEARSEIMLLTDPIYYFGTLLSQKKATNWSTFEDMKGRSVATVSGFTLVPELKEVSDRVIFMDGGQIVEQGPPAQMFKEPAHERTRAFLRQILER